MEDLIMKKLISCELNRDTVIKFRALYEAGSPPAFRV